MSHTNSTTNYNLPQFIGTDTPGWLTDVNGAMSDIDAAIYARQQGIATNANNITSLDGRLTTAEGAIADTDGDVSDLQTRMTVAEGNIASNTNAIGNNTSNINALNTLVSGLQAKQPVLVPVTLLAADWSNGVYTISDAAVTANSIINLGIANDPSAADAEAFQKANIQPGVITAGTGFTIKAIGDVPTVDIAVVYTRQEA